MSNSAATLPMELFEEVLVYLDRRDIVSVRQACRAFDTKSFRIFSEDFIQVTILWKRESLRELIDLSMSRLASKVSRLRISPRGHASDFCGKWRPERRRRYSYGYRRFMRRGSDLKMFCLALKNLPNCNTVIVSSSSDALGRRKLEDMLGLTMRKVGGCMSCLTSRAYECIFLAQARGAIKLLALEVEPFWDEILPFPIEYLYQPTKRNTPRIKLVHLRRLQLHLNTLEREWRGDGTLEAYQHMRDFVETAPNLKELEVIFPTWRSKQYRWRWHLFPQHEPLLLIWSKEPAAFTKLTRLVLRELNTRPEELDNFLSAIQQTLRSLHLHQCSLKECTPTLFVGSIRKLSNLTDLSIIDLVFTDIHDEAVKNVQFRAIEALSADLDSLKCGFECTNNDSAALLRQFESQITTEDVSEF